MRKEERHQIKRNDLATAMESAADYVGENRRSVTMMAAVAVGVLLLGLAGRSWWGARQGEGARRVGDLITAANASIIATVDDLGSNRGGGMGEAGGGEMRGGGAPAPEVMVDEAPPDDDIPF